MSLALKVPLRRVNERWKSDLFSAIKWPPVAGIPEAASVYDFRRSDWYLGAATSSKDVVILLDASNGMSSRARDAARAVVHAVLDTLGNNDFVTVFRYAETPEDLVPCFQGSMVQVIWSLL